jgi:hypothetical protein
MLTIDGDGVRGKGNWHVSTNANARAKITIKSMTVTHELDPRLDVDMQSVDVPGERIVGIKGKEKEGEGEEEEEEKISKDDIREWFTLLECHRQEPPTDLYLCDFTGQLLWGINLDLVPSVEKNQTFSYFPTTFPEANDKRLPPNLSKHLPPCVA